jgi:large subunit ribosomal protein L32
MAVPKRKTSKSKKRMRRASNAHKKKMPALSVDKQTGSIHLSHRVDPDTGMYNGRQVLSKTVDE